MENRISWIQPHWHK